MDPQTAELTKAIGDEISRQLIAHQGISSPTFWSNVGMGGLFLAGLLLLWKQFNACSKAKYLCQMGNKDRFLTKKDALINSDNQWHKIYEVEKNLAETNERVSTLEGFLDADDR